MAWLIFCRNALWFNVWRICSKHRMVGPSCNGPSATPFPCTSENSITADDTDCEWITGSSWTSESCKGRFTPKVHTGEGKTWWVSFLSAYFDILWQKFRKGILSEQIWVISESVYEQFGIILKQFEELFVSPLIKIDKNLIRPCPIHFASIRGTNPN